VTAVAPDADGQPDVPRAAAGRAAGVEPR
jgi:hypothetical protein